MISNRTDDFGHQWLKIEKVSEKIVLYSQVVFLTLSQGKVFKSLLYDSYLPISVVYLACIFCKPMDEIKAQFGSAISFTIARGGWYFQDDLLE